MSAKPPSPALAAVLVRLREAREARRRRGRRGVALVMVLGSLVILTVLVTELQEQSSSTLSAALASRDALKAEYHARSGAQLARLLIAMEPTVRRVIDPLFKAATKSGAPQIPVWKFTEMVLGPFNCPERAEKFQEAAGSGVSGGKSLGSGTGCFEVKVIDEDAKINVNLAVRGDGFSRDRLGAQLLGLIGPPQFNDLFEAPDADGQYANQPTVCGALVDWADMDDTFYPCDPRVTTAQQGGPEDGYYQQIGLPYLRKNAPYDSLQELRLVRGVNDPFWLNFVEPDPTDPDQRVLTVWGQDKINVNSANAQTLLAVVCSGAPDAPLCNDPAQISAFIMAVTLARELTQGAPLFKSPKAFTKAMRGKGRGVGPLFATLGLEPVEFTDVKAVEKSISTESRVFSIYADGVVPGKQRETRARIHTVVDFRSAAELGANLPGQPGQPGQPGAGGGAGTGAGGSGLPSGATPGTQGLPSMSGLSPDTTPEQLAAALASDPMGAVIYHRIE